ncbi:MAG TPA: GDP-L-fucose synthase [Burkholderiales bacterium]|nr:GDP-L-fucose synthase [Burkholderiales bacterium]
MKIYVAGHRGMAGSAIVRRLRAAGYDDIVTRSRDELDLTNQRAAFEFLVRERPDYIFLAAAKVGGIHANASRPAEFLYQNLAIEANLIHGAWRAGVQRMLFLGSSCIYPRDCPQPIKESDLLGGALEATNEPYAIAKIAGLKLCEAYNRQFGTRYGVVMPTNLYGPNDNYDLETSHVAAALLRKAHEAKLAQAQELVVWGTGAPRREFLHVDDLADACVFLMERAYEGPLVNVGTGEDLPIRELAELIMRVVGLEARLRFDTTKPDGTPRKLLDVGRLRALGWRARIPLAEGLRQTYEDFIVSATVTT